MVYLLIIIIGNGSTVTSTATTSTDSIFVGRIDDTTNVFSAGVVDLLDFASTSKTKTVRALSGFTDGTNRDVSLRSGFWNSLSATTSIDFYVPELFATGSRFSLYGIK